MKTIAISVVFVVFMLPTPPNAAAIALYDDEIKIIDPLGPGDVQIVSWEVGDLNQDGLDDIVAAVVSNVQLSVSAAPLPIAIFLSDGEGSMFNGTSSIIEGSVPRIRFSRNINIHDFNGDGQNDVFFCNHGEEIAMPFPGEPNKLLLSGPDRKLRDASSKILQIFDFSHGCSAGDVDGDEDIDIFVVNLGGNESPGSYLLINNGARTFSLGSTTFETGGAFPDELRNLDNPFYSRFIDVDNDGDEVAAGTDPRVNIAAAIQIIHSNLLIDD